MEGTAQNFVVHPERPEKRLNLYPKDGVYQSEHFHNFENFLEQIEDEDLKAENRRRYQIFLGRINPSPEVYPWFKAYLSEDGWVIELRQENLVDTKGLYGRPIPLGLHLNEIAKRVAREIAEGQRCIQLRDADLLHPDWRAIVALLEKDGYAIVGLTDQHPMGAPISEGRPQGYGLEGNQLIQGGLIAFKSPIQISSRVPEAPDRSKKGLNPIYTHAQALAVFREGEWGPSYLLPPGDIALHAIDTTAIQYAQGAFEGMIATLDEEGNIHISNLKAQAKRFKASCVAIGGPEFDEEQFIQTVIETVKNNQDYFEKSGDQLYVRPYVAGLKGGGGASAAKEYLFGVEAFPLSEYMAGRNAKISVQVRGDYHRPQTGSSKVASNYAPYFKMKAEVKAQKDSKGEQNYSDILSLDSEGYLEEFTAASFFGVMEDEEGRLILITPPTKEDDAEDGMNILPSLTRKAVIAIAEKAQPKIEVRVGKIHVSELPKLRGAFCTGTAAGITRIGLMDLIPTPNIPEAQALDFSMNAAANDLVGFIYDQLMTARQRKFEGELAELNDQLVHTIRKEAA